MLVLPRTLRIPIWYPRKFVENRPLEPLHEENWVVFSSFHCCLHHAVFHSIMGERAIRSYCRGWREENDPGLMARKKTYATGSNSLWV
jgi:hypothetical protein